MHRNRNSWKKKTNQRREFISEKQIRIFNENVCTLELTLNVCVPIWMCVCVFVRRFSLSLNNYTEKPMNWMRATHWFTVYTRWCAVAPPIFPCLLCAFVFAASVCVFWEAHTHAAWLLCFTSCTLHTRSLALGSPRSHWSWSLRIRWWYKRGVCPMCARRTHSKSTTFVCVRFIASHTANTLTHTHACVSVCVWYKVNPSISSIRQ